MTNLNVIILAGGLGKRMKSDLPKVLHCVQGMPMIVRLLNQVVQLNPSKILIVVGKYKDIIQKTISQYIQNTNIEYVNQEPALGTGHAVLCVLPYLNNNSNTLILNGDNPLLSKELLEDTIQHFNKNTFQLQISAIELDEPFGYGRIIVKDNKFEQIIEEKDCNDLERQIKLINCGIYIAITILLKEIIPKITNQNAQNEYYLTDIVKIGKDYDANIGLYIMDKNREIELTGVNTKEQLDKLNELLA